MQLINAVKLDHESVCDFCGNRAVYLVGNRICCSDNFSKCPAIRQKIRNKQLGTTIIQPKKICPICNKSISNSNYKKHIGVCGKQISLIRKLNIPDDLICSICNKQLTNKKSYTGHYVHMHTDANKKRIKTIQKNISDGTLVWWNKGKNKETDSRVLKLSTSLKRMYRSGEIHGTWTGKKMPKSSRDKMSSSRKKLLALRPDLHPNRRLAGNRSKMTYPEQLVFDYLSVNNYVFRHNFRIDKYWVDFIIDSKFVIEVDGSRWHSSPSQLEYDNNRDTIIKSRGYIIFRISAKNVISNLIDILRVNDIKKKKLSLGDCNFLFQNNNYTF